MVTLGLIGILIGLAVLIWLWWLELLLALLVELLLEFGVEVHGASFLWWSLFSIAAMAGRTEAVV